MSVFCNRGLFALLAVPLLLVGCDAPTARFRQNTLYVAMEKGKPRKADDKDLSDKQKQAIAETLEALFGTPDDPHLPTLDDPKLKIENVIKLDYLKMAAGPVGRDAQGQPHGLYREHCVHCHGISGDGLGPTAAFLNPYPRDYRMGLYKFKRTPKGAAPTDEDLLYTLKEGIAGTAMPSFKLLDDAKLQALLHYVKYLSIRGQVERALVRRSLEMDKKADEVVLDAGIRADKNKRDLFEEQLSGVKDDVKRAVQLWADAANKAVDVPPPPAAWNSDKPEEYARLVRRGNDLFHGTVAICRQCHGDLALGDGTTTNYDDWTLDWHGTDPKVAQPNLGDARSAGALPPRNILPRNLRLGNYRGGREPYHLYWRIVNGIDGTPMPAAPLLKAGEIDSKKLSSDDVWALIAYVRSLPEEPLSRPVALPTNSGELHK